MKPIACSTWDSSTVNPDDYVHRIGRTGRANAAGIAISYVPRQDMNLLDHLELTIGLRLPQKKLRGFDYRSSKQGVLITGKAKQDWRKRARSKDKNQQPQRAEKPQSRGGSDPLRKKTRSEGKFAAKKRKK